jgi:hypothetical protein
MAGWNGCGGRRRLGMVLLKDYLVRRNDII